METIILESLRPKEATNLYELRDWIRANNVTMLRFSELPEPMLLSITRELRQLEEGIEGDTNAEPSAAAGMALVLEQLMWLKQSRKQLKKIDLSGEALIHALRVLQRGLEREIVARLVGVRPEDDHENYLQALDACLEMPVAKPAPL